MAAVDASAAVTAQMVAALREILHNIAKHAHAKTVTVRLTGDAERIELAVTDDGVGFDVERAGSREADGHFGLRGLRERAEQVGGTVEISSEKRKGTGSMDGTTALDDLTTTTSTVRVGIADDNAVVRMGIRSLLATADDIVVVGEAGDGAAAVTLARTAKPDVMLLDVRMPRQDGVSAAPDVAQHATVLMLTYSDSPEVVSAAVKAGARGYLVHGHFTENELLSAVRMAARGIGTFSAQAVAALSNPTPSKAALASRYGLSEREADVMALMAEGAANSEIARSLFISEKTVKNHINRIFTKLQANNRGHAVSLWLAHH